MPTVRLAEGLALAVLLPFCFVRVRRSDAATGLFTAVYAGYAILPMYDRWQAWLAALLAACCAVLARRGLVTQPVRTAPDPDIAPPTPLDRLISAIRNPILLLALPAVFGAVALGGVGLWHALWHGLLDDRLAVTVNGTAAAVFVGGLVTGLILRRFSSVTIGRAQAVLGAGTLLGWLERMLYFSFLLAGQPTAAAFALTAKSAARFPALQREEEGLAEYYLIGSLSSLVVAAVTALLTRLALGMAAL
ncbi:hypothetical protein KDK95_25075 [Actinospica sp. MGRD01-02]|uniref:Uncharacterized protein n=1 Tax=Actinospica acidithermotolerans TaxID=2828514 RepID=A0A941IM22_9ACTN|nr:hypothetical protein [Actinospica acidithermotolerans]MBR7829603.1 hypothetical protein [Actinospica acidithermotolerans]